MSRISLRKRPGLLVASTAITPAGSLIGSPSAHAQPMLPLAPSCSQFGFPGNFALKQSTGDTVRFNSTGPVASGPAHATGGINGDFDGTVNGGIEGDKLDFTISWGIIFWNQSTASKGHYTGFVDNEGFAHGDTYDESRGASGHWDSTVPLVCATSAAPAPAPAPPPSPVSHQPVPPAAAAGDRMAVNAAGPTTLPAGLSGTYTVNVADNGDVGASAEVFINFGGALDQTDQVTPSGGFNCTVSRGDKGVNATVHCTAQQLSPKTTTPIVVHGRGMSPGAGQLVMTVNSDPGVQFDNKTQQLNVKIT
ncbi:MAG: hypothetical protein JWP83_4981 [Mycobacterium sp.]|nr:hypothetical protein [Mycobacterium sp.]